MLVAVSYLDTAVYRCQRVVNISAAPTSGARILYVKCGHDLRRHACLPSARSTCSTLPEFFRLFVSMPQCDPKVAIELGVLLHVLVAFVDLRLSENRYTVFQEGCVKPERAHRLIFRPETLRLQLQGTEQSKARWSESACN